MRRVALLICSLVCSASLGVAAVDYPLQVAADHRQVLDAAGQAIFFQGDTPWHILARLDREQSTAYLDLRAEQGFDALLISLVVSDDYWTKSSANAYGEEPFARPGDFASPNEAYFAHVDWFLDAADARGFTVLLCPAYIGYECRIEGWCQRMVEAGPETMRAYGRWLGERYRDQPNLIWVHGGDADAAAYGALEVVDALAQGIGEVDDVHLNTAHANRFNSALDVYDLPWLQLNNSYGDCSTTPSELRGDLDRATRMPFFYIEGRYEDSPQGGDVACIRAQAYWSLLGGAMGHFYGHASIWDFPEGWTDALRSEGAASMQHFAALLRSRPWQLLEPDVEGTILVKGHDQLEGGDYAAAARARDGSTILVYTPSRRWLCVDLTLLAGSAARGWWYDPRSGDSITLGLWTTTGKRDFRPPTEGDWVLVFDSIAAEFAAPGRSE